MPNSESEPVVSVENAEEMKGAQEYKKALIQLKSSAMTRSANEELSKEDVQELVEISREFLQQNDVTGADLNIEENDEIMAVVAMALLDYQKSIDPMTRTTAGGCVLEALGVKEIVKSAGKGAVKYVAKAVAKAALKKEIPYVGWGLYVWDYVACVTE